MGVTVEVEKPVEVVTLKVLEVTKEVPGPQHTELIVKEVPGPERVVERVEEVPGPERVVTVEVEKPVEVVTVKEVVRHVPGPTEVVEVEKIVVNEKLVEIEKHVPGPTKVVQVEKQVPGPQKVVKVEVETPVDVVKFEIDKLSEERQFEKLETILFPPATASFKADLLFSISQLSSAFKAASMERQEQHKNLLTELRKCDWKVTDLSRYTQDKFTSFELELNDRITAFMRTVNEGVVEDLAVVESRGSLAIIEETHTVVGSAVGTAASYRWSSKTE